MKSVCGFDVHKLTLLTGGYGSQFENKLEEESITI